MKIGIIGGSGLEKSDILQEVEEIEVETPYGKPSCNIKKALLGKTEVYILSRHGPNHEITPTNINNRANIFALAKLGCKHILATTACGSLKENIQPGHFMIANQFIDFTKHRHVTFFDDFKQGIKHLSLADPFSQELRDYLIDACEELKMPHHKIGTIITIEGPRFSTRAESFMFRRSGHVVNMSTAPEAILAKEANVEYAVIAMVTDYDCWKKTEQPVTWEQIEKTMQQNSENVKKLIIRTIEKFTAKDSTKQHIEYIRKSIRAFPNWPKQGVTYRDITTLLKDPQAMKKVMDILVNKYKDKNIDVVTGIESRGFIFGSLLAEKIGAAFVPVRKRGKLPAEKETQEYELEYGSDAVEIHKDAIKPGQKVLVVDDLIATGGTAAATADLVEKLGGKVEELAFVIELPDLKGREKLNKHNVYSIVSFEGE